MYGNEGPSKVDKRYEDALRLQRKQRAEKEEKESTRLAAKKLGFDNVVFMTPRDLYTTSKLAGIDPEKIHAVMSEFGIHTRIRGMGKRKMSYPK